MRKFRSIASYALVVVALTSFGEFAFALNTYSRPSETIEAVAFDDQGREVGRGHGTFVRGKIRLETVPEYAGDDVVTP